MMAYGDPYKGTVNYHNSQTGNYEVLVAGYGDVNARNVIGADIREGDTVTVVQDGPSQWKITEAITQHPAPVVEEVEAGTVPSPPSTNVTIPGAVSGSSGTVPNPTPPNWSHGLPISNTQPWNSDTADRFNNYYYALQYIFNFLDALVAAVNGNASQLNNVQSTLNSLRTSVSQAATGLTSVGNYAEDVGDVAQPAIDGANSAIGAAVESGTAAYVQDFSIAALPGGASNVASPDLDLSAALNPISLWLDHRQHWIRQIHAGLNRGLAHKGLAQCPSIGTTSWDVVGLASWSAVASRIQSVDDWASSAASTMRSYIASLNSAAGTGTPSYPSTSGQAWSNRGTFEASRAGLAASLKAHHAYYTAGLGTMTVRAIRAINGR